MKKPGHQWQTRQHQAVRLQEPPPADWEGDWTGDRRTEVFALRFESGRQGRAVLGLQRQVVDRASAADPDLAHAVRCWLAARGARNASLYDDAGSPIDIEAFSVADLGSSPEPEAVPRKLITLAPSNAEIVEALGCFERVLACEDSSDWPPSVAKLPRLGPDLGPDLDRIADLQPDLVVTSLSVPGMERVVTGVRARGLRQVVLAPRTYGEVLDEVRRVGRHLHVHDNAEAVVRQLEEERAALIAERPARRTRVYLEWWPRPMFTPGSDCYSNELIDLAGGVNVFADRPGSSLQIEPADVLAADPEVCFVSWCGVAEDKLDPRNLIDRPGLQTLPAARAGHVYRLDEAFSGRPGPRMLEAARRMATAIRSVRS